MEEARLPPAVTYHELQSDEHWRQIENFVGPRNGECTKNILTYLRDRGAACVVIENEYLDRDFTSEFAAFYALVFRRHKKVCRRLHFFAKTLKSQPDLFCLVRALEAASLEGWYLGYIVLRPLDSAPIGRTVLSTPERLDPDFPTVLVRAKHETHVLGVELAVEGAPFMQQDSRVAACAHASIWMAARHLHVKHREGWFSTVDIAEHASNPTDTTLASSLPSGSGGLNLNNMIRAIRGMGREPVIYLADQVETPEGLQSKWPENLRPQEVINRYVDSGIPVILAIAPWDPQQKVGHAITCFGHVQKKLPDTTQLSRNSTRAIFCKSFLVNDDQRGCYLEMPLESCGDDRSTPYSVLPHVYEILIPLPSKVYIKAEIAETIAWNLVSGFVQQLSCFAAIATCDSTYMQAFINAASNNKLIARTYLTHGWKYKKRIKNNSISNELQVLLLEQDLPRFVWVTEFGIFDDLNHLVPAGRRIVSHVVIDATTGQYWDSGHLIFHAPGFVFLWSHDPQNEWGPYKQRTFVLSQDFAYMPRVRGRSGILATVSDGTSSTDA